jgi:hypothetical protein
MRSRHAFVGSLVSLAGLAQGAELEPRGRLDKEVIRRVVRSHLHEVRDCIVRERQTALRPFMIRFTIARTGQVSAAGVERAEPEVTAVAACVADAARSWVFPAPAGGRVVVSYPFTCLRFAAPE